MSNDDSPNWPMFEDIGGLDTVLPDLREQVLPRLKDPDKGAKLDGILLRGPVGCGKTTLALAIANEAGLPFHKLRVPPEEGDIEALFSRARSATPSIVFIDDIDTIAPKDPQEAKERGILASLLTCIDESHQPASGRILVIGATNRPDAIHPDLTSTGRFDHVIPLGVPNRDVRKQILTVLTHKLKLEDGFDLAKLSRSTAGFVVADLASLVKSSVYGAFGKVLSKNKENESWWRDPLPPGIEGTIIKMSDFKVAAKNVKPAFMREGLFSIPMVKWKDIGGYNMLKAEFNHYIVGRELGHYIVDRIKRPTAPKGNVTDFEKGFLLYGPIGCGKTLIAEAVAHEAGATFIHIMGTLPRNEYASPHGLGMVRTIFNRARTYSPCIIFFDQVHALTRKHEREWVFEELANELLAEFDGADVRNRVYVIGATDRPDLIDPEFLQPGRFGKLLYVPLPEADERGMILEVLARNEPIAADVDLIAFGRREECAGFSGADLGALLNEAANFARDEEIDILNTAENVEIPINDRHFEQGLARTRHSVRAEDIEFFENFRRGHSSLH